MHALKIAEIVKRNFDVLDAKAALEKQLPLERARELGIDPTEFACLAPAEIAERVAQLGAMTGGLQQGGAHKPIDKPASRAP